MPVVFFLRSYRAIFGKEHLPILSSLPSNLIRLSSLFPQPSTISHLPSSLSPWSYDAGKRHISRADCVALNNMAEEICSLSY